MKVKYTRKTLGTAIFLIASVVFVTKCNPEKKRVKFSDDASLLSKIINLKMNYATARWEIYGFPEQSDSPLAIGPTDDIILVAELAPLDLEAFHSLSTGEVVHIKVASARPWLQFRLMAILEAGESSSFNLSTNSSCRPLEATLRKSDRSVSGIVCKSNEKAVVVLFLSVAT